MYLIWHTARQGWISKSAGTSTDLKDAQRFDRAIAIQRCKATRDYQGNYAMVPVAEGDLV